MPISARRLRMAGLGIALLAGAATTSFAQAARGGTELPAPVAPARLAAAWDAEKVSWPVPPLIRHADVEAKLAEVQRSAPDLFRLETIGASVEGRSINHLWFGRGPQHVLLWSQMHGDEPTATAALFDIFEYVSRHRADPFVARILDT